MGANKLRRLCPWRLVGKRRIKEKKQQRATPYRSPVNYNSHPPDLLLLNDAKSVKTATPHCFHENEKFLTASTQNNTNDGRTNFDALTQMMLSVRSIISI